MGSTPEPEPLRLQADDDAAGARLDAYLAGRLPQYSRSRLQTWIRAGRVLVDGTAERSKYRLSGGETLEVRPAAAQPATLEPADIPLDILHRDDDLLATRLSSALLEIAGSSEVGGHYCCYAGWACPRCHHLPRTGAPPRGDFLCE